MKTNRGDYTALVGAGLSALGFFLMLPTALPYALVAVGVTLFLVGINMTLKAAGV